MGRLVVYLGTFQDDSTIGAAPWTKRAGVDIEVGGVYAQCNPSANQITHYLRAQGDFSQLPDTAVLSAVKVEWLRHCTTVSPVIYDNSVRVAPAGVISGDEKSAGLEWILGGSVRWDAFGGPSDPSPLWGVFTTANLKDPATAFLLSGIGRGGSFGAVGIVEAVRVTVDYA